MFSKAFWGSLVLMIFSQLPILILLWIFFRIPGVPSLYRFFAIITVLVEAALMFDLININVQKVRANSKSLVSLEVFERRFVPWSSISEVSQIVVSPLNPKNPRLAVKFLAVKTDSPGRLPSLADWWSRNGPSSSRELSGLLADYDSFVASRVDGFFILWSRSYVQRDDSPARIFASPADSRESWMIDDICSFSKNHCSSLKVIKDFTFPSFVRLRQGRKYDSSRVWDLVND